MQIWADARYLVRNARPQKDSEFIEFIRQELLSRTLFVMEHTAKAQGLYHKQLQSAEKMATIERQGHATKQWLTAVLGPEKLKSLSSPDSLLRVQDARRQVVGKVIAIEERITQVEDFLKMGLEDDFPAVREAGPLLINYFSQCLVLQKARLIYYDAEECNRQKLIGWLDSNSI